MLVNERISRLFTRFAEQECKGSSPLYEFLSYEIAMDEELLKICMNANRSQPLPNLLFGAVQYLLLEGIDHPLKCYYPSMTNNPLPFQDSYNVFKDFCLKNRNSIVTLLQTRLVQTNEVRRSAYLYPAFSLVYELSKKPLALIEIGTSAGLQLVWDQYSYSYKNREGMFGKIESELHITSLLKGSTIPDISVVPPPVAERIGLDLHIVNVKNMDEKRWLEALIWPEHKDRLSLFRKATALVTEIPLTLVEGDGVALLNTYIGEISFDYAVCIFHTHVANQMPKAVKELLLRNIEEIGKSREIYHIFNNIDDQYLHMEYYKDGMFHSHLLAETDGHGRWFKWLYKKE